MTLVSVDIDDTLIRTGQDYTQAIEQFGDFMHHEYDIPADRAEEVQEEIDYQLHEDDSGLGMERFPKSFIKALEELVDDPKEQHREHVREIGESAYKTADEYAERGFMPGAREMLDIIAEHAEHIAVVTVGVEDLQSRKIEALNLHEWADEVHVAPFDTGKKPVLEDLVHTNGFSQDDLIHVGNSARSDIEPVVELGGTGVYIPEGGVDWLSCQDSHAHYQDHHSVHHFNDAHEFIDHAHNIVPTIPESRTTASD